MKKYILFFLIFLNGICFSLKCQSDTIPQICSGFVFDLVVSDTLCYGHCSGKVEVLNLAGNNPPYTVQLNGISGTSFDSLCAGTGSLIITDNSGISCTTLVSVTEYPEVIISLSVSDVSCYGSCNGEISASVTGGSGSYDYNWLSFSTGDSLLTNCCPGNYTLIVSDAAGCMFVARDTIWEASQLTVSDQLTVPTCQTCCDGDITLSSSGGIPPYFVSFTPAATPGNFCAGSYDYQVWDSEGCSVTGTVVLGQLTSVQENSLNSFFIFPTVADDMILISSEPGNSSEWKILDSSGRILLSGISDVNSIDVSSLSPGIYFFRLAGGSARFIKK